ncbi:response regulator transcription factor [Treponema sp.]|uniref:response regulator transcription factor n=1 Tax=Treponema sp. TaxID=166 RepID=UPI00298E7612|nr:response regulator transcription factor [Treponema sp.]MCR5612081.1 response regulator transcription factor [Treponema sp.]
MRKKTVEKTTLFIVDDHRMLLNGLKNYLEENSDYKIPHIFLNASDCLDSLVEISEKKEKLPQIIIVDIQLKNESGFDLVKKITKMFPTIKCVMYSMYDTAGYILQAKECGAKGYISKVASEEELLNALNTVANGGEYIEKRMEKIQQKISETNSLFSPQEKIIFEKILEGKTNRQIANELFISLHSVENYVTFIYSKTYVKNRSELIEKFQEK